MAEALLREKGGSRYEAFSAGTQASEVRPLTLRVLEDAGLSTEGLHSKSIRSLLGQPFDYVITVCDSARAECPVVPGAGQRLHWSYEDPSLASGPEEARLAVFRRVFKAIEQRVERFVADGEAAAIDAAPSSRG